MTFLFTSTEKEWICYLRESQFRWMETKKARDFKLFFAGCGRRKTRFMAKIKTWQQLKRWLKVKGMFALNTSAIIKFGPKVLNKSLGKTGYYWKVPGETLHSIGDEVSSWAPCVTCWPLHYHFVYGSSAGVQVGQWVSSSQNLTIACRIHVVLFCGEDTSFDWWHGS